mmetsp:Transcript_9732/g.17669  ORF Transcript_9732/g.17669 Transcript_9732/m.17669 type:complete len:567 (+) Transcript_9732:62-1762(+)|eukprot:CAMPEP_0182499642 /NCGR_PEP_ID=MMETSP1321-20130603/7869_1 /TAXON_ID=91990 /ORGANISM="Bolidomonas sp., Strain RCC1657" /LENGTH=566 /DNA_ID=CAMNT_0024703873 /DNA_START=48 /DNA_END=1748 /DNA_ORIENTATION=+
MPGDVMEQQIEDLRERMRLLQQDRRANVDLLETNKTTNADETRYLREENKDLRIRLSQLQRTNDDAQGENQELVHAQREVLRMRAEYDSLKSLSTKHSGQLNKLKDEVKTCTLESKRPNQEDNPMTRQIRILENRLDKAMIKYNEAQSIKTTYEQIVKRLKEERVGFDNQLQALERTLQAKQRDYEELLFLSGDANHAREVSQQELQKVKGAYEEERLRRETELRERHQVVQLRKTMYDRAMKREAKRQEIIEKSIMEDGIDGEGESALRASMSTGVLGGTGGSSKSADEFTKAASNNKIDIFENAFRKIKEATGVSDVNEVIKKIEGQEGTSANLMSLTKENQARVESLTESRETLKKKVEEIKYSSSGGGHRRKMVDDKEESLSTSINVLDRWKGKYERFATTLISVKAGIKHLQDKIENAREDVGGMKSELQDDTIVHVLRESEDTLLTLFNRVKANQAEEHAITGGTGKGPGALHKQSSIHGISAIDGLDEEELRENRPFNQRINLPNPNDDGNEHEHEDNLGDLDEEELTRDKVKKASSQILVAQDRRNKKSKKKSRAGGQ